jgi:hypothetical protein
MQGQMVEAILLELPEVGIQCDLGHPVKMVTWGFLGTDRTDPRVAERVKGNEALEPALLFERGSSFMPSMDRVHWSNPIFSPSVVPD